MNYFFRLLVAASFLLLFIVVTGCAQKHVQSSSESTETTCVQGTVKYKNPINSNMTIFPKATVSTNVKGIVSAKTNSKGNYCLKVPLGNNKIDLKVQGPVFLNDKSYVCSGSASNINLPAGSKTCGKDCVKADIKADYCREIVPIRRGR